MIRMTLAAAAAFALLASSPALACDKCNHKDTVAAADKVEKKDAEKKCHCGATDPKDCKCGAKCTCASHKHEEKKDSEKKS